MSQLLTLFDTLPAERSMSDEQLMNLFESRASRVELDLSDGLKKSVTFSGFPARPKERHRVAEGKVPVFPMAERFPLSIEANVKPDRGTDPILVVERGPQDRDQYRHVLCGHSNHKRDCHGCSLSRSTQASRKKRSALPGSGADPGERVFHADLRGRYERSHRGNMFLLCVTRTDILPPDSHLVQHRLNSSWLRGSLVTKLEKVELSHHLVNVVELILTPLSDYRPDWTMAGAFHELIASEEVVAWLIDFVGDLLRRDMLMCVPIPDRSEDALIWGISRFLFEMSDDEADRRTPYVLHVDGETTLFKSTKVLGFVALTLGRYHKSLPGRHCAIAENVVRRVSEIGGAALQEPQVDSRHYDSLTETCVIHRNVALYQGSRRFNVADMHPVGVLGTVKLPPHMFQRIKSEPRTLNCVFIGVDLLTRCGVYIEYWDSAASKLKTTTAHVDSCRFGTTYAYGLQRQGLRSLRYAVEDYCPDHPKPEYSVELEKTEWLICDNCERSRSLSGWEQVGEYGGSEDPWVCGQEGGENYLGSCLGCGDPEQPKGAEELDQGDSPEFLVLSVDDFDPSDKTYRVLIDCNDGTTEYIRRAGKQLGEKFRSNCETARKRYRQKSVRCLEPGTSVGVEFSSVREWQATVRRSSFVDLPSATCWRSIVDRAREEDVPPPNMFSCLQLEVIPVWITRSCSRKEAENKYGYLDWKGAFAAEVSNLTSYESLSFPVRTKPYASKSEKSYTYSKLIAVRAVKNEDLDRSLQKAKVRGVIFGCRVLGPDGKPAEFERLYDQPASILEVRVFIAICLLHGFPVKQFDVESAYLNAKLKDVCYVQIADPEFETAVLTGWNLEPKSWLGSWYKVEKAIYGHPQAGFCWADMMSSFLTEYGLKRD